MCRNRSRCRSPSELRPGGTHDHRGVITPAQALEHLEGGIAGFVDLIGTADLDARVPACPDWTVRDLVVHLGDVHRWVLQVMTTDNTDEPPPEAPDDDAALARWYRGTATDLTRLLAETDPDTPVWTFGPRPRTAAFWFRRQAHEVGVHHWDLGSAAAIDVGYDRELAEDGIDEVVTMFFPRQVRLRRIEPLTSSLGLEPTGSGQRWVLSGDGTAPTPEPDATVSGPAADLLLLLWGRLGLADQPLRLSGSPAVAASVLAAGIVP